MGVGKTGRVMALCVSFAAGVMGAGLAVLTQTGSG